MSAGPDTRFRKPCFSLLAFCLLVGPAAAQLGGDPEAKHDERVQAALDEAKLPYTIDKDGDFKITYSLDDGRTQLVFVNSNTETYKQFEIREIWSVAYTADDEFAPLIANKLLADNEAKKLGAWQTKRLGSRYAAAFVAKVAAGMSAEQIATTLNAVVVSADAMEKILTDKDDF